MKALGNFMKDSRNAPEENDETSSSGAALSSTMESFVSKESMFPVKTCCEQRPMSLPPSFASGSKPCCMDTFSSWPSTHITSSVNPLREHRAFICGSYVSRQPSSLPNEFSNTWGQMYDESVPNVLSAHLPYDLNMSNLDQPRTLLSCPYQNDASTQSLYRPRVPGHYFSNDVPYVYPVGLSPNHQWIPGGDHFGRPRNLHDREHAPTDSASTNGPVRPRLPPEQRKVFVTYATDSDEHVKEVIKFVTLLRANGFDTQIDIFEQNFRSISKIDFMEKFIRDKEFLIIIVISPKYHEAVTCPYSQQNDESHLNAVYIYKQLQNEFLQNGSKNFRFVPVLFPGAKDCHVPTWLQNTHVYRWPQQTQDILRRLMRLEKYIPPPIGQLPNIISIPI